ncbi:hypothetical protein FQZ97_882190 [compost metagenome]
MQAIGQVVLDETDAPAPGRPNPPQTALGLEVLAAEGRFVATKGIGAIQALLCPREKGRVDVAGEQFQGPAVALRAEQPIEQEQQAVGLLAGATAGTPQAQAALPRLTPARQQRVQVVDRQPVERLGIATEIGFAYAERGDQRLHQGRIPVGERQLLQPGLEIRYLQLQGQQLQTPQQVATPRPGEIHPQVLMHLVIQRRQQTRRAARFSPLHRPISRRPSTAQPAAARR